MRETVPEGETMQNQGRPGGRGNGRSLKGDEDFDCGAGGTGAFACRQALASALAWAWLCSPGGGYTVG